MLLTTGLLGFLLLGPAHAAKPSCGDGKAQGSEQCDGADLDGQSCETQGYSGGSLSCAADCTLDTSGCDIPTSATCGDGLTEDFEECDGADDAACPGGCSAHCACPAAGTGDLEIHAVDVGQGDGILVISPDGFSMLIDAGTDSQSATIQGYMSAIGLNSLDYTLVTHMDADHVGGMDGILAAFPEVTTCFDHGGAGTTLQYDEYDLAASSRRTALAVGELIDLGPSMTAEVVHAHAASGGDNNNSVVIKLTYGDNTVLLGGDCEAACEGAFDPGPTQLYKVHHHGSSSSTTEGMIQQMRPYTALISVGASNPYGHPTQATLDTLAAYDVAVYRTDLDGDLAVMLDGAAYTVNGEAVCASPEARVCGESDVGECALGALACVGGMWDATCAGEVGPVTEDCLNGLDDDCDGLTDGDDPQCGGGPASVVIAQVAYDTPGTDSVEEFVDLYNPTAATVPLDDWSLSDGAGSWGFPANTDIAAGAYLSVARDSAGFQALYGLSPDVSGMTLSLNNSGDVLSLTDGASAEVDRVAWEDFEPGWSITAPIGDSILRADPYVDTDDVSDWSTLSPASPLGGGAPDTGDTGGVDVCGDGVCDVGEDCETCASDCPGVTSGKPANRYCCGNEVCEPVGEDSGTCPVDCL